MKTSEQLDKLSEALAAAQGQFEDVIMTGKNPHFKAPFSTLNDLKRATKTALSKNGLALVQFPAFIDGRCVIFSRLLHKSGQWLEGDFSLRPDRDAPQPMGSAISYGCRYMKRSILDLEAGAEDDDGEVAEGRGGYVPKPNVPASKPEIFTRETHETKMAAYLEKTFPHREEREVFFELMEGKPATKESIQEVITEMKTTKE